MESFNTMFSFFKIKKNLTSQFPTDFVDIHSHLLPNIDDGSKSFEESASLIKRLNSYGIKNFVTTPHIIDGVWNNSLATINTKLFELTDYLTKQGIRDIQIRAAAEYMLDSNFEVLLQSKKLLTIKDPYILIEFSYINPPINLKELLFKIQIAGYQPILAHPERYSFFHKNYKEYFKLKESGCFFQLNLLSLSNYYGSEVNKIAKRLLKDNLIDFAGTDTHNHRHLDALETITNSKLIQLILPVLENNSKLI
tara:strand:+ start:16480 stop:17235 length:756 start_codon:yes stop_codon:yes gene_type:complete